MIGNIAIQLNRYIMPPAGMLNALMIFRVFKLKYRVTLVVCDLVGLT